MRCALCVFALFTAAWGQTPLQQQVRQGHQLTTAEAEATEKQLAANEWNIEARARLVGYYFEQIRVRRHETPENIRLARRRHIAWFIENDPASDVLRIGDAFAMSGWMEDSGNYNALRKLWLAQIERAPDKLPVLRNAAGFLQQHDRPMAVTLMRRAYEITSRNDLPVTQYYATQLGLLWLGMGNDGTTNSQQVAAELDASNDPYVVGFAGVTIAQHASPEGAGPVYARTLLRRAIALAPQDRFALTWQSVLKKLDEGAAPPQL